MSSNEKGKTKSEKRFLAPVVAALLVFAGGALQPASRAQAPTERWVGSWSTALVGRPQTPPLPGPPAPAPFMRNACPAPAAPATPPAAPPAGVTFAPPPFVHFTNQTLRQIVRTSVGGSRLRVGAEQYVRQRAPHDRRGPHRASREATKSIRAGQGRPLTFSGRSSITIPANADCLQRSRCADGAAVVRSCRRCVSARHNEYAGTARDAQLGVPDVLHL